MNKVVLINLGGRAYQLEEAGAVLLSTYLDNASARLSNNPGKEEILADLERAVAEKCDRLLSPHKTVVTTDEVKMILDEMGPVEGDGKANRKSGSTSASTDPLPKRLYLIREGAMISGVCNGLAAYFDVDVTLVRVLFVGLTILTGGGMLLFYFILTLLIPYADTDEAFAAAHGEPFRAQDIVDRAKERIQETYERVTGSKYDKHEWKRWKREMKYRAKQWKYQKPRSNPLFGVLIGALGLLWILALLSLVTTRAIFGWAIPAGVPIWIALILLFVLYHVVVGPLRAARYAPYAQNYQYHYSEWDGVADGLTALFIFIACIWAYLAIPEVHYFINHLPQEIGYAFKQIGAWLHR